MLWVYLMFVFIYGIIGYIIIFFVVDGGFDLLVFGCFIECLIDGGVYVIVLFGSIGEGVYLSDLEWDEVVDFILKIVVYCVLIIVSVFDLIIVKIVCCVQFVEFFGVEVVMVLLIFYWKFNEVEVFQYYCVVGEVIGVLVMFYNNLGISGIDMLVELILCIVCEVDNVIMVKESIGDIQCMYKLCLFGEGWVFFYNGCNLLVLEVFVVGVKGWCSVVLNLILMFNGQFYQVVFDGDLEKVCVLFYWQLLLFDFIFCWGLLIIIKVGLGFFGLEVGVLCFLVQVLDIEGCWYLQGLLEELC